ncbi:hypothetical protein EXIGLDRAFT_627354, partial [Exidia glandulosa HHB12029]
MEAFLAGRARARPPPPEGYQYDKDPHISAKEPPSPCKLCGGNHWDKECKHWRAHDTRKKQPRAYFLSTDRPIEEELMYVSVYNARVANRLPSADAGREKAWNEKPVRAASPLGGDREAWVAEQSTDAEAIRVSYPSPRASLEEEEDRWYQWYANSPKADAQGALLSDKTNFFHAMQEFDPFAMDPEARLSTLQAYNLGTKTTGVDGVDPTTLLATVLNASSAPAGEPERVFEVVPKRQPPAGHSSVGISVLTAGGHLGSRVERPVLLRLDSGANITLIAKSYLEAMKSPPKIRQGMKVSIAQLTNNNPKIEGYVLMPIWIRATDNTWLKFQAEMYVVPDMTVEVLLGEDWHVNNELSVLRSLDQGTKVVVGQTGFTFNALSTIDDLKPRKAADGRVYADGAVRAWKDVTIPAESWADVEVAGDLQQGREWYVERALVPLPDGQYLTVPNAFLSLHTEDAGCAEPGSIARRSVLPVCNPTRVPRVVRAGTVLGHAKDPKLFLDTPKDEQDLERLTQTAEIFKALIA